MKYSHSVHADNELIMNFVTGTHQKRPDKLVLWTVKTNLKTPSCVSKRVLRIQAEDSMNRLCRHTNTCGMIRNDVLITVMILIIIIIPIIISSNTTSA